ncbi:DUF2795 domain-containing protein [Streptomyces pluripotens]|uniref:DUF2795 domain-containing protein n=1 Tax=Streptomyces pluripotens TaxID=1355015 RepID=A0A221P9L1_9ACTN|nr:MULTISPECIES: DUF2795 domain-containing protein [Streptomyces]ARP74489.1 hypothetical protein LK06_027985 [Streptomyces pluripotens]ASN28766.1 DUF2795 domain-containing protein [Streptomyces pluripotens]KIE28813.1 hypothetical protein LK08_00670 [Streptomyces sp. MUSC 125]MCH0558045.1 DUF2795 domain-containing protein [Streptomyces sp. MUM 16J]
MQRGSDRLSVYRDDEMKHELKDLLRSGHPTRVEEWHDPEPTADDDPEVWSGPVAPGQTGASVGAVRLVLARYLNRHLFPAKAGELARVLRRGNAPGALIDAVADLPRRERYGTRYENVQQLAEALVGRA